MNPSLACGGTMLCTGAEKGGAIFGGGIAAVASSQLMIIR